MLKVSEGQLWSVRNDNDVFCLITSIDELNETVHIAICDKSDTFLIYHLPLSIKSFQKSVSSFLKIIDIPKETLSAIEYWKNDEGGIWELNITDIIELLGR